MMEIEVKLRIADVAEARRKLLALGARVVRDRALEENVLFDFPGGGLAAKRQALRLRIVGRKAFLTFKGEPRKSRSFKVREEFETEVRNGKEMKRILAALGFREAFAYRKHRTWFRTTRLAVTLDETAVGNYIELEGERHEITRFARSLGCKRTEFITRSYVEMIAEAAAAGRG